MLLYDSCLESSVANGSIPEIYTKFNCNLILKYRKLCFNNKVFLLLVLVLVLPAIVGRKLICLAQICTFCLHYFLIHQQKWAHQQKEKLLS